MRTKSLATFALAGTLALAPLTGCMGQTNTDATTSTTEQNNDMAAQDPTVVEGDGQLQGGWTVNTQADSTLSGEDLARFEDAVASYDGVDLEAVAVLAQKEDTETSYAYLCKAVTTSDNSAISWAVATLSEDAEGNANIVGVEGIELNDIEVGTEEQQVADLLGSWELRGLDTAAQLPNDAAQAFEAATEGYVGMSLTPMVLLGSLQESGANYLVLCQGATVTGEDQQQALCVAHVYEDSAGNAQMSSVDQLDLLAYV